MSDQTDTDLSDYRDRLNRAHRELTDLALGAFGMNQKARLIGKRDGVALALSYLREYPALNGEDV